MNRDNINRVDQRIPLYLSEVEVRGVDGRRTKALIASGPIPREARQLLERGDLAQICARYRVENYLTR